MTHITKLTEIIDGRLLPSDKKLSASLLEVDAGRLTVSENTLGFDATGLATETFVSNAIASAQLGGGEVDLSGYATKDDLAEYATTEELLGAFNEITTGMPLLVADEVNAAIASVVDGAPETFDTLKEIAEWIETDGAAATDLASDLAGKADKSELDEFRNEAEINTLIETYVMETYNPQLGSNITLLLDAKVDKVEGKGLSTNDFTDAHKTAVESIETTVSTAIAAVVDGAPETFDTLKEIAEWIEADGVAAADLSSNLALKADKSELEELASKVELENAIYTLEDTLSYKLDASEAQALVANKMDVPSSFNANPAKVNSIPLYTLDNGGEYVLCTPDAWLSVGGYLVPGYSAATVGAEVFNQFFISLSSSLESPDGSIYSLSEANIYINGEYVATVGFSGGDSITNTAVGDYGVTMYEYYQRSAIVRNDSGSPLRIKIESVDDKAFTLSYSGNIEANANPNISYEVIGTVEGLVDNTYDLVRTIEATLTPGI